VDETLQKHPIEGWDDLVKGEVGKAIEELYNEEWPRDATLNAVKKHLLGFNEADN
jgi:hypothetical protein